MWNVNCEELESVPREVVTTVAAGALAVPASRPGGLPRLEQPVCYSPRGQRLSCSIQVQITSAKCRKPNEDFMDSETAGVWNTKPAVSRASQRLPLLDEFRIKSQMIPQISGDQEVFSHPVVTGATHGLPSIRVAQELDGTVSGFLHRGHEESVASILNLDPDAAHVPTDHWNALPEGLADDEPAPSREGLRQCDVRLPLEYVHLDRADASEVGQKVDIRIIAGMPRRPLEPEPTLRIALRHPTDHEESTVRYGLLPQPICVDHSERVFPWIESAHLTDHRSGWLELEPREDRVPFIRYDLAILRAQGIDRGRRHDHFAELHFAWRVALVAEDRRVILLQVRSKQFQHGAVRCREVDVASPDPTPLVIDQPHKRSRLRIVDDDDVEVVMEVRGIRLVHLTIGCLHGRCQARGGSLERVVNRLRGVEEDVRPGEDEPVNIQSEVRHQGHDAVQKFRDASPIRGRVHVRNSLPFQLFRKGLELPIGGLSDDGPVVCEVLRRDHDFLHVETWRGGRSRGSLDVPQMMQPDVAPGGVPRGSRWDRFRISFPPHSIVK